MPAHAAEHTPTRKSQRDYTVPSVASAVRILRWLQGRQATLSEISSAASTSKSTTFAILKTLEGEGLIVYDRSSKHYFLGLGLLPLGEAAASQLDYVTMVKPVLRALAEETALTGMLVQPLVDHLIVVHKEEGTADVRATMSIGQVLPVGAGAVGKAFSAFEPREDRSGPLVAFTPRSIVDPRRYEAELDRIRQRGYATSDEEYRLGVNAVAAPVFDHRGRVSCILSLIGFASSMPPSALARLGECVKAACAVASHRLGVTPQAI